MLRQYFLFIVILLLGVPSRAGDWSQWWHVTPGKNEISNQSYNDIHRNMFICRGRGGLVFEFIEKWYFYKGHIIGTLESNQTNRFFIINEQSCTLDTFDHRDEFEAHLSQKRLKPIIWTRWYDLNWGYIITGMGHGSLSNFIFFGGWLLLPVLVFAMFWTIGYPSKRNLKWILILMYVILFLIRITLDIFPGSI